jgi:hypothetical protein
MIQGSKIMNFVHFIFSFAAACTAVYAAYFYWSNVKLKNYASWQVYWVASGLTFFLVRVNLNLAFAPEYTSKLFGWNIFESFCAGLILMLCSKEKSHATEERLSTSETKTSS